jgi:hypothetical protein
MIQPAYILMDVTFASVIRLVTEARSPMTEVGAEQPQWNSEQYRVVMESTVVLESSSAHVSGA